ncbi:MAG: transcriptional initiation protein Tat [Burkholderiaceae bacterium]
MSDHNARRAALKSMGLVVGAALSAGSAGAATGGPTSLLPEGAKTLAKLRDRLSKAPRRRDFKTVPMILNQRDQWDHEALDELVAYRGAPRQVWDNTDLGGPWLNLMRNSLNAQIWSFRHPDFLVVSATHGLAHLALFDQPTWDKYGLAKLAGEKFPKNSLIVEQPAATLDARDFERSDGVFSPHDNSIVTLQRRGVAFLSCHNAIWETAEKLIAAGMNPDKLSHEALAADLTNHLISDVILTPGAVGTLPELQQAGFHYAK